MIVVDVLLVCVVLLFARRAVRVRHPSGSLLGDLLARAHPVDEEPMGEIVPFPTGDELARRRARAHHPSGHQPCPAARLPHPSQAQPGPHLEHPSGGIAY